MEQLQQQEFSPSTSTSSTILTMALAAIAAANLPAAPITAAAGHSYDAHNDEQIQFTSLYTKSSKANLLRGQVRVDIQ